MKMIDLYANGIANGYVCTGKQPDVPAQTQRNYPGIPGPFLT